MSCAASRLAACVLAGALASCGSIEMSLPAGFLELRRADGQFRATTPEDDLILVREFTDSDEGGLEFWAKALANDLVSGRGYRLLATGPIEDSHRRKGTLMRFLVAVEGRMRGYLVAVWVRKKGLIRVAEFVADKERFDARVEAVTQAFRTIRP